VGPSAGVNISCDFFFGKVYGGIEKLKGTTEDVNYGFLMFNLTLMYDPSTKERIGWTFGVGQGVTPFSLSLSWPTTSVKTMRDFMRWSERQPSP
jgi:hypothetical protein